MWCERVFVHTKPPRGRSGGMLVGINLGTFDVGEIEEGEYFVRFRIRNKEDGFQWNLIWGCTR